MQAAGDGVEGVGDEGEDSGRTERVNGSGWVECALCFDVAGVGE